MAAVTYTPKAKIAGLTFTCPRCHRAYAYPHEGDTIRCECGWWYKNVGQSHVVEEFHSRIGGA